MIITNDLTTFFLQTRSHTEEICAPTTWFFEEFILSKYFQDYKRYHPEYNYVFNSYYESVGKRVIRTNRGNLSRPTVSEVYKYRDYVTAHMQRLLEENNDEEIHELVEIGIHHEKQHQELLLTDIKFILGNNPLLPKYNDTFTENLVQNIERKYITIEQGVYDIGYTGHDFCYDNELGPHKVYLDTYKISNALITNKEYLDFINDGGYNDPLLWHAEAWDWLKGNTITLPLYWHCIDNQYYQYTLQGLKNLDPDVPVTHISYYEAFAFAQWQQKRLPTEFEWEVAQKLFDWGSRWEWTESAYAPYPNYKKAPGALGEYNGIMANLW